MKLITDLTKEKIRSSIVTLGKFDGNHIGHQRLFETAISHKKENWPVVVFTFNVPPAEVLGTGDGSSVRTILTHEERLLADYPEGVDYVVEFPFTEETRSMSPEAFVKDVLVDRLGVKLVVVGVDFCFGKNRSGNVKTLEELGSKYGFSVIPVEKVRYRLKDGMEPEEVSSTLIKQEIQKGNLDDVRKMLGRPFAVSGEVLHGKHLGRTIGFPTLNLSAPEDKILPPNGVYATCTCFDGKCLPSVTNVGIRPTFDDGTHRTVETYVIDFSGDLYGKRVQVDFYEFIRPEKKFDSPDELKKEISKDLLLVRKYFEKSKGEQLKELC